MLDILLQTLVLNGTSGAPVCQLGGVYSYVGYFDAITFVITMGLTLYLFKVKNWLVDRWNQKSGKPKHGTYIEVTFWDVGIKTGNFPAIKLDDLLVNADKTIKNGIMNFFGGLKKNDSGNDVKNEGRNQNKT